MTPTAATAATTPRTLGSRTPRLAWPTGDQIRSQIEDLIGPSMRQKGASDAEVAREVIKRGEVEIAKQKKLKASHRDFEAFFVGMLFTEMKKSVHKSSGMTDGGRGEEIFDKMLTQEQSKVIANRGDGIGVATMLDQAYLRGNGVVQPEAIIEEALNWREEQERANGRALKDAQFSLGFAGRRFRMGADGPMEVTDQQLDPVTGREIPAPSAVGRVQNEMSRTLAGSVYTRDGQTKGKSGR